MKKLLVRIMISAAMKLYPLFLAIVVIKLLVMSTSFYSGSIVEVQKSFYVAPSGNDNNPGTLAKPFATIQKARETVESVNKDMKGDIMVYLRDGVYELKSTFTLTSKDAGSNGYNIIYQAYKNETPVISGGMKITGWTIHDATKNIYKAVVDKSFDTRQLYVNGRRAVRARSVDATGWKEYKDGFECPVEVAKWKNISNIEVVSIPYQDKAHSHLRWKCHRGLIESIKGGPVDSIQGSRAVMSQPYWNHVHVQYDAEPAWIENAYELLDSEGEWYLNRSEGVLYYKPLQDENIASAEIIFPKLETLISGTGVSNVQFKGIIFEYATWTYPNSANGFSCLQADGMVIGPRNLIKQVPGNIVFDHSTNIRFENSTFKHFGITSLQFYIGCKNNLIYNNVFKDISGSAITIGDLVNPAPSSIDLVKDNTVDNNLIRDAAVEYLGCVGIQVGYSEHNTIIHNEIRHLPYTSISVGWGWRASLLAGKNNEISYNRIDSGLMVLEDGAGIYTLSNQSGTEIHHNYISNQFHEVGGIYPDEGTSDMHWHHNVVQNIPRWLHIYARTVQNDTIDFNYYDNPKQTINSTKVVIQNNVYISDGNWPPEALAIMKGAGRVRVKDKLKVK